MQVLNPMSYVYDVEVLWATNNWWSERQPKGAHHYIIRIIPFLFDVLNSLYIETRKLPLRQKISGAHQKQAAQHYLITIGFFLPPQDYYTLRLILSLVGDIYNRMATACPHLIGRNSSSHKRCDDIYYFPFSTARRSI